MAILNIKNAYFHNPEGFEISEDDNIFLNNLESILKCGYIYSRALQKEMLGLPTPETYTNYNGRNYISLCKYNEEDFGNPEDAFTFFCRFGKCIIIRPNLGRFCNERTEGTYKRMLNEFQFRDKISIQYFLAIGFIFNDYKNFIEREILLGESNENIIRYLQTLLRTIEATRDLLKQYRLNIPIINIPNGEPIPTMEEIKKSLSFAP